jgi:hypothetical protein
MSKVRSASKVDNFTAISEPSVYKMWEPRYLTFLWAPTACKSDSFTFFTLALLIMLPFDAI